MSSDYFFSTTTPASTDAEIMQILYETEEYLERQGGSLKVMIAREGLELKVENVAVTTDFHIEDRVEDGVVFMSLSGKFGGQATQRLENS